MEQKLQLIIDERDCLLTTLSDAQQTNALLQQENANQQLVVSRFLKLSWVYKNRLPCLKLGISDCVMSSLLDGSK